MNHKPQWLILTLIVILTIAVLPGTAAASSSSTDLNQEQEPGDDFPPPDPPPPPPSSAPPPDPDTGGYTSANEWVNHALNSCGVVRIVPDTIPAGVTVSIEEFAHPPQDANGIWGLSPLVALNVNADSGGSASLTPPGAEVCICASGLDVNPAMANWSPGENGGVFTPVPYYWNGPYLCTRSTGSNTFGLIDQGYLN